MAQKGWQIVLRFILIVIIPNINSMWWAFLMAIVMFAGQFQDHTTRVAVVYGLNLMEKKGAMVRVCRRA